MAVRHSTGSASWIEADAYELGEFHTRATRFFATVKWEVLESILDTSNGVPRDFGNKYSIVHFNMVHCITFADGVSWIARLRLLQLNVGLCGDHEVLDVASILKVEISGMKFLKYVVSGKRVWGGGLR